MRSVLVTISTLTALVVARPQPPPPGMHAIPPHLAAVLPKETLAELEAVHRNAALSELQKHEHIDRILVNLPDEVHDRVPLPPGFERLPSNTQQQFRQLHRDRSLNFQQRHQQIRQIIDGLAPEHRNLLPPPPGFPQF